MSSNYVCVFQLDNIIICIICINRATFVETFEIYWGPQAASETVTFMGEYLLKKYLRN